MDVGPVAKSSLTKVSFHLSATLTSPIDLGLLPLSDFFLSLTSPSLPPLPLSPSSPSLPLSGLSLSLHLLDRNNHHPQSQPHSFPHAKTSADKASHSTHIWSALLVEDGVIKMGFSSPTNKELLINSIGFYVPSVLFFMGRILSSTVVLRRMQIDDYLMIFFFFIYTALLALINASSRFATNLFPSEQLSEILSDPAQVHGRIVGSIMVIPLEQCMLLTTWGVKACLLIFLHRMTRQMPKTRTVLYCLAAYVAMGYIVIMVCYYLVLCRPFNQYWALPVQNSECATYSTYSKIQMCFNISSDIFIILMPTSIIYRSRLPIKRKAVLMMVFSLGFFTIICAILNKVYNFLSPQTTVYQLWYIREASVAMWVGNIVCCWQLVQWVFHLRSFDDKHAEIQGRLSPARSAGGHTKNSAWYRKMFVQITGLQVTRAEKMTEMVSREDGGSMSGTTLQDEKKVAEHQITNQGTLMSLLGHDDDADATHAIKYRRENNIA